jgi:lipopolysaccharide assembly protein A
MQIVRTIVWVVLLVALTAFAAVNWDERATVKIWENLVVETNIPAIVVVSFLIGFVPMWLLHRATRWQLGRRIGTLESTARNAATIPLPASAASERDPVNNAQPVTPAEHPAPISAPVSARVDEHRPPHGE